MTSTGGSTGTAVASSTAAGVSTYVPGPSGGGAVLRYPDPWSVAAFCGGVGEIVGGHPGMAVGLGVGWAWAEWRSRAG